MLLYTLVLHLLICADTATHKKPVPEKLWSERCTRNSYVLNDCNWCWCNQNHHYECKARVCEEIDAFGHFKDTIVDADVGMEGHGSWRSTRTPCDAGVEYRRRNVRCICDEDGNWPNPVCRDLFRVLHPVEVTEDAENATSQTCSPTKLYLVGCNVCICPSSGKFDAYLCTNRSCLENDPVLAPKESTNPRSADWDLTNGELEIYGKCTSRRVYKMGCRACKCLSNNRLVCDPCTTKTPAEEPRERGREERETACTGRVGSTFRIDCNKCECHSAERMYCTARKCVHRNKGLGLVVTRHKPTGKPVQAPMDDRECVPGTSYRRRCNTCYCQRRGRGKVLACTVQPCDVTSLERLAADCVEGTTYERDDLVCACAKIHGQKYESCNVSPMQSTSGIKAGSPRLDSLHGHCEPSRVYKRDCNTCTCLASGRIVRCTTEPCGARPSPVAVALVPVQQPGACPGGRSYTIGCNVCFCLSNGNALCTTADCSRLG